MNDAEKERLEGLFARIKQHMERRNSEQPNAEAVSKGALHVSEAEKERLEAIFEWIKQSMARSSSTAPNTEAKPRRKADKDTLKAELSRLAKKEICISYEAPSAPLDICSSKIGGKPAVPSDFVWPEYSGTVYGDDESRLRPLSFMAQINLKDVAYLDEENLLPKSGVLSFFYEPETMVWGFEPEDRGAARVFYFPDETELSAAECPDSISDVLLPEFAVSFTLQISLPCWESFDENDEYDLDDYEECADELGYELDDMGDRTKLLGYPDVIQSPMEEECETVTRGYRLGTSQDHAKIPEAEKADIKEKSREWMLLFQMGTITGEEFELMFGDCGHIYFWIKKEDLLKRNFNDIWLVLQCG